jgi:phosphohistidine swiveling domain-containing protein
LKRNKYILPLAPGLRSTEIGNKAQSLLFLKRNRLRIPETYILTAPAFAEFIKNGPVIFEILKDEIKSLPDYSYAIRSSTSIEDSETHSFAGQFLTLTSVRGYDNILNAIIEVWKSAASAPESYYGVRAGGTVQEIRCAVIIQKMIVPLIAGVCFSKNPVNNLNEIVIESVEGKGEDLVQRGVTPYRWRFKGKLSIEGPENYSGISAIRKVASDSLSMKKLYKRDVDVEWAYDGEHIYYLQIRAIQKRDNIAIYSNRMVREMLPGQIKPLVWDVNIPLFNSTFLQLVSEITGPLKINPVDLTKPFHYRVYMNMSMMGVILSKVGLPADSLEFMLLSDKAVKPGFMPDIKLFRHTFRLIRFVYSKLNFEQTFLAEFSLLERRYKLLQAKLSDCSFIDDYPELFNELFQEGKKLVYLNIMVPLLMQLYNKRFKNKLQKVNADYELIDFNADFPELNDISPVTGMNKVRQKYNEIPLSLRESCDTFDELVCKPEAEAFVNEFQKFIKKFGHLSDSGTDFSVKKWQEDPGMLYRMIIQSPARAENNKLITFRSLHLSGIKYSVLGRLYRKAGKFKVYREQISSLYILGYGLFRALFLGLGREFVNNGIISAPEDIFFLNKEETDRIVMDIRKGTGENYSETVARRKKEMDDSKDYILPSVIFGEEAPILERGNIKNLNGVGTSSGIYHARTTIVRVTADFDSVSAGDVLVIPFADVSWTPILVKAGAIVSESGGMLSHCSIIARELGIPALVSVDNACSLLAGKEVTVDGSNGIVTVHDYE